MALNKQTVDESVTNEKLVQPSIFDNETIKDLKGILQDVVLKIQETQDQEKINQEVQRIKQQDGQEVEVDANFGKPMANAD